MKVIDITGKMYNGMWYFGEPWPRFHFTSRYHELEGIGITALIEDFEGMGGHTGLHIETPATGIGYDKSYPLIDVPIDKLAYVDAYVLQIPHEKLPIKDGKPFITLEDIKKAEKEEIPALLDEIVREGDLVMTMGAGDVWRIGEAFGRRLAEKAREPDG